MIGIVFQETIIAQGNQLAWQFHIARLGYGLAASMAVAALACAVIRAIPPSAEMALNRQFSAEAHTPVIYSGLSFDSSEQKTVSLNDIENHLNHLLGKASITTADAESVQHFLRVTFENKTIARSKKIMLLSRLWRRYEKQPAAVLLLLQSVKYYKPRELSGLMFDLMQTTTHESVYISTLDLLRESYSDYYYIGKYVDAEFEESSREYSSDVLSLITHNRFRSRSAAKAFERAYLQFAPLAEIQQFWQKVFLQDFTLIDSSDLISEFMSTMLGRKADQKNLLQSQLDHLERMPKSTRRLFVQGLRRINIEESHALTIDAKNMLDQFFQEGI